MYFKCNLHLQAEVYITFFVLLAIYKFNFFFLVKIKNLISQTYLLSKLLQSINKSKVDHKKSRMSQQ